MCMRGCSRSNSTCSCLSEPFRCWMEGIHLCFLRNLQKLLPNTTSTNGRPTFPACEWSIITLQDLLRTSSASGGKSCRHSARRPSRSPRLVASTSLARMLMRLQLGRNTRTSGISPKDHTEGSGHPTRGSSRTSVGRDRTFCYQS